MKTIFSFSLLNVANTLLLCAFLMLSCSDDDDEGSAAPPEVASISPNEGPKATLVTINGTNFGTTLAENEVTFNGKPATITAASATQLTVSVPSAAGSGPIVVKTNGRRLRTSRHLLFIGRLLHWLDPPKAMLMAVLRSSMPLAALQLIRWGILTSLILVITSFEKPPLPASPVLSLEV